MAQHQQQQHTKKLKWGIMGTGVICQQFADAFQKSFLYGPNSSLASQLHNTNEVTAVVSRHLAKAQDFAKQFYLDKACPGLKCFENEQEFFKQDFDVAYIGSLNNEHFRQCKMALEHNKHVLLEKPFTITHKESHDLIELAKSKHLFLMEGMWTRCFPAAQYLKKLLNEKALGEVKQIGVNFGFFREACLDPTSRLLDPKLGGGALFDIGIYVLSMTSFFLNDRVFDEIQMLSTLNPDTKVDDTDLISIHVQDVVCQASISIKTKLDCIMTVYCERGYAKIAGPSFHCPSLIDIKLYGDNKLNWQFDTKTLKNVVEVIYDANSKDTFIKLEFPYYHNGNGLEYEIEHVHDCIVNRKLIESDFIPLEKTLYFQYLMEQLPKQKCIKK